MSRVSVVIPVYNGEQFLADAVRSVWDQTLKPHELIVVDDCSRDGSLALAERLASESPVPMTVTRLPQNSGGPARPINVGVRTATGELVTVLDQDDVFLPNRLERHAAALAACPDADVAFGWCAPLEEPTTTVWQPPRVRDGLAAASTPGPDNVRFIPAAAAARLLLVFDNFTQGFPGFTFRRAAWNVVGGVVEEYTIAADYDFLCRLARRAGFAYLPEVGYLRREHGGNATQNRVRTVMEVLRVRERHFCGSMALRDDAEARAAMLDWFAGTAYLWRQRGELRTAATLYRAGLRVCGWKSSLALGLAKVWPVGLVRRAAGRT
ncbi:glycosyltransferase family 2 protein [Frigoriglobus tundricola]|uniref:GT2 family glycosyltransferase n=1 Tax=Frigoriglobus tundricola TaxID=2774151 RepID=A0A6M5YM24_9BACT|nr:glycosyltransferase family 2 protein [Frigoriglobus tundricola]QJW94301.1 GT2 family glycosyltransferase [Frigoriglobus tundricola]